MTREKEEWGGGEGGSPGERGGMHVLFPTMEPGQAIEREKERTNENFLKSIFNVNRKLRKNDM